MSKENNEIAVKPRTETGNNAARRARRDGMIPAVVYAKGRENRNLYLDAGEWASLSRQNHHMVYLVEDGKKQAALVREVQFNHLKNYFVHVDFQAVEAGGKMHTTVTLRGNGDCAGVARGGILEQMIHELPVECTADALVDEVKVDLTALEVGGNIFVKDLALPAGIVATGDADAVVFHVARPKADAAAATEAAAEPEAVKPAKKKAE